MEWEKVELPEVKSTRIQAAALPDLEFYKIQVASALSKRSTAEILKTATLTYLSCNWDDIEARLVTKANQLGMSKEELFNKICSKKVEL